MIVFSRTLSVPERNSKRSSEKFRILVERYQSRVYGLAYRMSRRHEDAQDAVQDTFVHAYSGLHTFSENLPFWPWLRRIAVNCCIRKIGREIPTATK